MCKQEKAMGDVNVGLKATDLHWFKIMVSMLCLKTGKTGQESYHRLANFALKHFVIIC